MRETRSGVEGRRRSHRGFAENDFSVPVGPVP